MTELLTTEALDEGERLCREATPGPWMNGLFGMDGQHVIAQCCNQDVYATNVTGKAAADAKLIAWMGTNIPALFAAARRELALQQKLAELEASFRTTASVLSDRSVAGAWLEAADRIKQLRRGGGMIDIQRYGIDVYGNELVRYSDHAAALAAQAERVKALEGEVAELKRKLMLTENERDSWRHSVRPRDRGET